MSPSRSVFLACGSEISVCLPTLTGAAATKQAGTAVIDNINVTALNTLAIIQVKTLPLLGM